MSGSYREEYRRSLRDPDDFRAEAAGDVDRARPWDRVARLAGALRALGYAR